MEDADQPANEETASQGDGAAPAPPPPDLLLARPPSRLRELRYVLLAVILTSGLFVICLVTSEPRAIEADRAVAELFKDRLLWANAEMPEQGRIGYAVAYDLLTPARRSAIGYPDFLRHFDDLVFEHGPLDAGKIDEEAGDFHRRRLYYRLSFSGTRGKPEELRLTIELVPEGGTYRIDEFAVEPMSAARGGH